MLFFLTDTREDVSSKPFTSLLPPQAVHRWLAHNCYCKKHPKKSVILYLLLVWRMASVACGGDRSSACCKCTAVVQICPCTKNKSACLHVVWDRGLTPLSCLYATYKVTVSRLQAYLWLEAAALILSNLPAQQKQTHKKGVIAESNFKADVWEAEPFFIHSPYVWQKNIDCPLVQSWAVLLSDCVHIHTHSFQ